MEIDAVNSLSDLLQEMASSQAREIKKAAILTQMGAKVAMASKVSEELIMGAIDGGYQMDGEIPEDSTVSYHV